MNILLKIQMQNHSRTISSLYCRVLVTNYQNTVSLVNLRDNHNYLINPETLYYTMLTMLTILTR